MSTMCLISIHAPARGATALNQRLPGIFAFQSTLPRGERRVFFCEINLLHIFQSTLPRGERRCGQVSPPAVNDFNPRSREGSDSNFYSKSYLIFSKNCLKLLKSLYVSILQNIFKHSMTYFQVRIPQSIYVSLAFAPNL